jgi:hypothetical protein
MDATTTKNRMISNEIYKENCLKLFKKLRYPNASLIFRPPLKRPPPDMMDDFEQNGDMPIKSDFYIDNTYSDSGLDSAATYKILPIITKKEMDEYREKVKKRENLGTYNDKVLTDKSYDYRLKVENKKVVVIGTEYPWIEAIASYLGASKVTTIDYTRKTYEESSSLEWIHVYDYFDKALATEAIENHDTAYSFSSIEHSGLGRYGDALSPYGDVETVQQVHCMLKPGGYFFLALPSSTDGSSYIEFNAHRVYGIKRLGLLFKGWRLIDASSSTDPITVIYILKKSGNNIFDNF